MSYLNKKKYLIKIKIILASLTLFFITGCEKYNLAQATISNPQKVKFIKGIYKIINFSQNKQNLILSDHYLNEVLILNWKTNNLSKSFSLDQKANPNVIKVFNAKPYFSMYQSQRGQGKLWNSENRKLVLTWTNSYDRNENSSRVDISKSGKYFFAGGKLINLNTGKILIRIPQKNPYYLLNDSGKISYNEKILATTFSHFSGITFTHIETGKRLVAWEAVKFPFPFSYTGLGKSGFSKNDKYFFVKVGHSKLYIYDITIPQKPVEVKVLDNVGSYKYLENLNALLIFSEENKGVRLISLEDNFKTVWSYSFDQRIWETSSPVGKKILAFSFDRKRVFGIDLITGKPLFQFLAPNDFYTMDISYDNQLIALNTKKGIYIYKTPNQILN